MIPPTGTHKGIVNPAEGSSRPDSFKTASDKLTRVC